MMGAKRRLDSIQEMVGELKIFALDELKAMPKVWEELGPVGQAMIDDRLIQRAYGLAINAISILAAEIAGGSIKVPAMLESLTIKDGTKATIKLVGPNRLQLADYVGGEVIVLAMPAGEDLFGPRPTPMTSTEQQADAFGPIVDAEFPGDDRDAA
jgi:hypothetical protein